MTDKYDLSGIDALPAAPKPQSPAPSKYDLRGIDQLPALSGFDKTASLFTAAFGNPSEEAEKRRLSADIERITGTYAPVVDIADATRQRQQLQADHATRASPRTSEFLSVPENAAVAIQDAKTMAQIEAIIGGDPLRSAEIAAKRFAMSAGALGAKVGFDFPAVATDIVGETLRAGGLPDNYNVFKDMSASARRQAVATRNAIEYFTPEARNMVERAAASAGESAGMSLQLLPLATATPQGAGMAAAFGLTTFAESYTKAREAGKGPLDSLKYAIPQGAFEGLFEMAPAAFLADALKNAPGLKQFTLGLLGKEIPTEMATTVSQNLNDWVTFNPGKAVADFIAEQPEALAETAIATIMGASIQAGLIHGAQRVTGQFQQMQEERRTKQLQETLTSLFEEAKGVKSDPVTFQSFMAGVTDNATVFINADALQETLAQNKIEASALPSLAEQLAQPSVTGDVEVPIGELMTAFAGTPAQEQIVQHARVRQDDLSAAEQAKFGDMAAFFKKQGEAVAERQKANEQFVSERQEIEAGIVEQLGKASPFGQREHRYYAQLMGAFYSTAAELMGTTPKQIQARWAPNILGATDQAQPTSTLSQGFDHGNAMLNVGLDVGATDRAQQINAEFVKAEIEKLGVQVLSAEEVEGEYEYEGKPVKELTYVPHLSRPLTEAEVNALAIATGQEAIGQYDNGTGNLWGPNAANWGAFNPEFFKDQAGTKLSEAQKELAQKKTKTPKITEIVKGQKLEQSAPLSAKQWSDVREIALETLSEDEKTAWLEAEQEVLAGVEEANRNSDVLKEIAKTALDKMPVPRVSTVPLLAGRLKLKIEPTGNFRKDGSRKTRVPDVARALFNKFRNAKASVETPEGREIMARAMTHEALYALSQDGHAVGWYDRKVREAIMTFALVHPEVLTSPRHNLAFRLIAAITSNGQAVRDNFILANDIYNLWAKDQVFPTEFAFNESQTEEEVDEEETPPAEGFEGGGQRKPAMVAAFKKINVLVKELGWDAIESEMLQLRTVRDVEKEFGLKIGGENKDTVIPTAVGLGGPKIGNFFANLSGYFDSPTMDLWFMRTAGRMEGTLLETKPALVEHLDELLTLLPEDGEVKGQSVATLRKEIEKYKALDKEAQLDAETTLKTLKHVSIYARAQFSQFASPHPDTGKTYWDKSDANVNARRLVNNLAAVLEAPSSGGERNNLRAVVTRAMELLEKQGISLTAADLQAVLWYHEKNLYSKVGDISASAKPWDYASAARFSVGRELGLVDVGSRQRAEAVPAGQPAAGGAGGLGAVQGLGQEDQGGALAQAVRSSGAVAGPVVGIHYSQQPRTSLASSAFGSGMPGAERERLAAATDPRIKQRVAFYVNTGKGITPESGVGPHPHVATLRNLYDADADALKIWRNSKGDMNAAESAVLDAGFDGYLTRNFGGTGAAVMLGSRNVDVESVKREDVDTVAELPPSAEIPRMKQAAMAIIRNRSLPNGQQSVESWKRDLERTDPDTASLIAWDKIPAGDYYKDQIAGQLWQTTFKPVDTESAEFKRWFGDSKVVDAEGRPLVVYHGTSADFSTFSPAYTAGQMGFHFGTKGVTEEIHDRNEFNDKGDGANTLPVYLAIRNPLRLPDLGGWQGEFAKAAVESALGVKIPGSGSDRSLVAAIKKAGYDGVVYRNELEDAEAESDSYIAFDPTQIKSAISNTGEFSSENPSILFAESAGPRRGSFNPLTFDLRLLADANRSTFIHEASHFFMAAYIDMASQPDAPPQLKEFVENLLGYLFEKVPGGAQVRGEGLGQAKKVKDYSAEPTTDAGWIAEFDRLNPKDKSFDAADKIAIAKDDRLVRQAEAAYAAERRYYAWADRPEIKDLVDVNVDHENQVGSGFKPDSKDYWEGMLASGKDAVAMRAEEAGITLPKDLIYQEVGADTTAPGAIPEGRTNLERWQAMTLDQQRAYWEFFAEGFEQYAMTGKAPTKALQTAFSAFAKWMKEIYKTLKNFVTMHGTKPLDAELTQYFDRMLATDEELEVARAERGFQALFKNLAESGMSPAQFADYMALEDLQKTEAEELLRSRSIRDMKWLSNAKSKAIKELQAEADELRALVQASVEEELANTPIRQAERWLKKGEMKVGDDQIKAQAGHRLNMEIVKAMFPEGAIAGQIDFAKLGRGKNALASSTGTQHPDDVAQLANEQFGGQFRNGEDLVRQLLDMPAFKDEVTYLTDLRMLEEHGDLATPEAIAKAADEAIHNDAHLRMVATEVWALGNRTGSVAALTKAAKAFAQNLVDNTVVKKLSPSSFANAATRAGKAAVRAVAKKDTDVAATEKRTEMVNAAAAKAAYAAETEVRAIVTRLRKISAYSDKHSSVTIREMGVVQAVRAILAEFEIGQHGEKATKYLKTLNEYDPTLGAVLDSTIESLAPEAKPWQNLKVAELRELHAAVTGLWRVAKDVRSVELAGEKMSLDDARAQLIAKLEARSKAGRDSKAFSLTDAEIRNQDFQSYTAKAVRPESWISMQDGLDEYGPWRRLIWNTIDRAQLDYSTEKAEKLKALKALLVPVMSDMTDVQIDAEDLGGTFGAGSVIGYSELLHAILHTGNLSNKTKLLVGRGWGSLREDGSLDSSKWDAFLKRMYAEGKITKTHMDFVQGVWDLLESMKEGAQKAHRATTGRYFEEIEPSEIVTPFGVYRGGYAPAIVDRRQVADMDLRKLQEAAEMDVVHSFEKPAGGFTKSRAQNYNQKLELNIAALGRHIDQVLLFSHMSVPVRNVQRVLKGKDLSSALAEQDRAALGNILAPWLHSASTQTVTEKGKLSYENMPMFTKMRSRAGAALMFANVSNSVQQLSGFFPAALKVSKKELLFAAAKGWYKPRELAASVAEMSPYMKQRIDNEVHAMAEEIDQILLNPTKFERAQDWAIAHSYFLQTAVDSAMSPIIWQAKFNEATARGAEKQEAIDLADSAVRMTQGSNRAIDIAAMEKGSPFYRMFMQFAGYFNTQVNLVGEKLAREKLMADTPAKYGRIGMVLTLGWLAPAIASALVVQLFRGGVDDDDKDGEWLDDWLISTFLAAPAKYVTAAIPVFGQAINAALNAFNDKPYDDRISMSPAVSIVEAGVRGGKAAIGVLEDPTKAGRAIRDIGSLVSLFTGVPVTPATKAIGYATDVETGKVNPTGPVDYGRGIITGTASPESKR